MTFDIPHELKNLPKLPGVYIMKNADGVIIYVGKAVDLRSRISSYFRASQKDFKTIQLAKNIHSFEYVVTDTENEALILENNLIKLHWPKYNIRLKDDKAYPYIKITNERFPRVIFSHQRGKDKAKYYGPYVSKYPVKDIIQVINKLWPLRRCNKRFPRDIGKDRPCLNHHIGQCSAPCNRLVDENTYMEYISEAEQFILGRAKNIQQKLSIEMAEASEAMEFERAAELRDIMAFLTQLSERQKVESGDDDRDFIALARKDTEALAQIFFVRGGKLSGREHYMLTTEEISGTKRTDGDILEAFIKQFYSEAAFIPKEICLACGISDQEAISNWLSLLSGRKTTITIPVKGEKRDMAKLTQTNAELTMSQFGTHIKKEAEKNILALNEIKDSLRLVIPLGRIEAYDISNIQGYESVGSMVVFEDGKPKKSDYRKFRLRAVVGPDDYRGMEEILTRRMKRFKDQSESFAKMPDIIFVDGGKGQVSTVEKVLRNMEISIPVCGIVKDARHRTRGLVFCGKEVTLPKRSEGFRLITRIQDEVHRFAYEYHRKLREKTLVRSVLDEIEGVGKTRRKELLKYFKSIEGIMKAEIDELSKAPSMNKKIAEAVYNYFNN